MGDALDGACTAGIFAVDERQESVAQGKLNGDLAFTPHEYVPIRTHVSSDGVRRMRVVSLCCLPFCLTNVVPKYMMFFYFYTL
jgi:hypothetical protein